MTAKDEATPNVAFYVVGLLVIVAGIGLVGYGVSAVVQAVQRYGGLSGGGMKAMFAAATTVFWGAWIITAGRIVWRGARRRGAKDRFGRLLIIAACVVMGFAFQGTLAGMGGFGHVSSENEVRLQMIATFLPYVILMFPAGILAWIGGKLARETKPLVEASAEARF